MKFLRTECATGGVREISDFKADRKPAHDHAIGASVTNRDSSLSFDKLPSLVEEFALEKNDHTVLKY